MRCGRSRAPLRRSHQLDKVKAGSLEQVYDEAVDNICLHCGLKTRCWQQEYTDTLDVFHHLTPLLRRTASARRILVIRSRRGVANEAQLAQQINLGYQEFTAKEGIEPQVARGALGGDRPVWVWAGVAGRAVAGAVRHLWI